MKSKLQVLDQATSTNTKDGVEYICITDIAKYKGNDRAAHIIGNWIRNRNGVEFKLYLIKEFLRLKEQAFEQLGWDIKRILAKVNYLIHTDAIQ